MECRDNPRKEKKNYLILNNIYLLSLLSLSYSFYLFFFFSFFSFFSGIGI